MSLSAASGRERFAILKFTLILFLHCSQQLGFCAEEIFWRGGNAPDNLFGPAFPSRWPFPKHCCFCCGVGSHWGPFCKRQQDYRNLQRKTVSPPGAVVNWAEWSCSESRVRVSRVHFGPAFPQESGRMEVGALCSAQTAKQKWQHVRWHVRWRWDQAASAQATDHVFGSRAPACFPPRWKASERLHVCQVVPHLESQSLSLLL